MSSYLSKAPGVSNWPYAPVMCTHRHAWSLQAFIRLAGLFTTTEGYDVAPSVLASDLAEPGHGWCLRSPAAAICAESSGTWSGWQLVSTGAEAAAVGGGGGLGSGVLFRFSLPIAAMPTNASLVMRVDGALAVHAPMELLPTAKGGDLRHGMDASPSSSSDWVFMHGAARVEADAPARSSSVGGHVNVSWIAFAMQ